MKRTKLIKRFLVYVLVRAIAALFVLMPLRLALFIGAIAGRIAFIADKRDRKRAIEQLQGALGVGETEAVTMARRVFSNVGMVAAELAVLPRIRRRFERYVELPVEDRARLEQALALGRGVIFVSAHLGNWELLAQRIAHEGFDAATLARKGSNPFLNHWLVGERERGRVETINRGDPRAARRILAALRRGALLGALLDQATKVESVHVPFFGRLASTPTAAAALALRSDIPVICGFIQRKPHGGGHRVRLERVTLDMDPSLPKAAQVEAATRMLTEVIERAIRAQPEEWVWFHARWKTERALTS